MHSNSDLALMPVGQLDPGLGSGICPPYFKDQNVARLGIASGTFGIEVDLAAAATPAA